MHSSPTHKSQSESVVSRRTLLSVAAGSVATLAGCSGGSDTEASPDNEDGGGSDEPSVTVLGDISVDEGEVIVPIEKASAADTMQLINPDGGMDGTWTISDGMSQVAIPIDPEYSPGEYTFLAVRDNNGDTVTVDSQKYTIGPDLTITRVATSSNLSDEWLEDWEDPDALFTQGSIYVWVENTGTAPAFLTGLEATGHVPEETEPGTFEKADAVVGPLTVRPGETTVISTEGYILQEVDFAYPSEGTVSLTVTSNGADLTQKREITFEEYGEVHIGDPLSETGS